MGYDLSKKRQQKRFLLGIISMTLVMIADWLTGALGPDGRRIGIAANAAWVNMADWRFIAAAVIYALALPGMYMASMELINLSRAAEIWSDNTSRRMGQVFRTGIMAFVTMVFANGIIRCLLPMFTKMIFETTGDMAVAAELTNKAAVYTLVPAAAIYMVMVLAVSAAWTYDLYKKKISLPFYGYLMNPLAVLVAGLLLRRTGIQFFADFTTAFGALGWLLLFYAAYLHTLKKAGPYIPQ